MQELVLPEPLLWFKLSVSCCIGKSLHETEINFKHFLSQTTERPRTIITFIDKYAAMDVDVGGEAPEPQSIQATEEEFISIMNDKYQGPGEVDGPPREAFMTIDGEEEVEDFLKSHEG